MGLLIKEQNDRRDVEWPQVAMHRNCHFLWLLLLLLLWLL